MQYGCFGKWRSRTLSLKEMLHYYILHQEEVVERRTRYDLAKAEARAHIFRGLCYRA